MAATAETAKLIASLELRDNMSKGLASATRGIGKLEQKFSTIGPLAQRGVSSAITNITRLGLAVGVGLVGAIGFGIRSLGDLQRSVNQTNAVIASTGGKAGVSAAEVRKYAESLENLSTVDDKVIQDGENMLLTFTGIGKDVFPRATKAALNMAIAMANGNVEQVDMKASAIQLGKALNDPVKGITALRKVGVAFTADQVKQIKALVKSGKVVEAQTIILKELETEFGKSAAAAGKGPEASWRRLQDVGEDLSQTIARGVLPVLVRASDWLSKKLSDPAVVKRIDEIGAGLGRAADKALAFIETVDFGAIANSLGIAVGFAGDLVNAFLGLPEWVKVAVITGWGLNKLTGGALGGIIGELGKGLIKGVLGMNAGVVNINAGVVNGAGGVPGVAPVAKGGLGLLSKVFIVGEAIGLTLLVNDIRSGIAESNTNFAKSLTLQNEQWLAQKPTNAALENGLKAVEQGMINIQKTDPQGLVSGESLAELRGIRAAIIKALAERRTGGKSPDERNVQSPFDVSGFKRRRDLDSAAILQRALAKGFKPTDAAVQATLSRNIAREEQRTKAAVDAVKAEARRTTAAAQATAAAVRDKDSSPQVTTITNVNVSASDVVRVVTTRSSIVKPSGSRGHAVGTGPLP